MLESIGVKNFRSLKNINLNGKNMVDIKPLTVLLGKNSSGKSSFLRLFPLFKQSVSTRTRGALAFFGDEVDFGDFHTTISNAENKKNDKKDSFIEFDFSGIINRRSLSFYTGRFDRTRLSNANRSSIPYEVTMKVSWNEKKEISYISFFSLKIFENTYSFEAKENGTVTSFSLNKIKYADETCNMQVQYALRRSGFPYFEENENDKSLTNKFIQFITKNKISSNEISYSDLRFFRDCSMNKEDEIKNFFEDEKSYQSYISNEQVKDRLKKILSSKREFHRFYNYFSLFKFGELYEAVVQDLCDVFQAISYSKPLRANADRYYRSRFFFARELNSDGSNLVDFFVNLSNSQQSELTSWMKENFGFWYSIESLEGHKSIFIYEKDDVKHNITDMGFGFSQILPVVTQLWSSTRYTRGPQFHRMRTSNLIYAIEQPELHLHPSMQCSLIKAIVQTISIAKERKLNLNFIIETHSESIINQIGRLIRSGKLTCEESSVLIFSKNNPDSFTKIQSSSFDKDGFLTEWPIGFFGE